MQGYASSGVAVAYCTYGPVRSFHYCHYHCTISHLSRLINKAKYEVRRDSGDKTLINIRLFVCDQYKPHKTHNTNKLTIYRFDGVSLLSAKFAILHSANERLRDSGEQVSRVRVEFVEDHLIYLISCET
jgi:hypothetical protein